MGKWTATVELEAIEFDGDQIVFNVNRLLTKDMGEMARHYNESEGKLQFTSNAEVCTLAADLFPRYVNSMHGMTDGDGAAINKERFVQIAQEFYFAPLVGQLFAKLMEISVVGTQAKNSVPPSPVLFVV